MQLDFVDNDFYSQQLVNDELRAAQLELDALQQLVAEVPELMEQRFKQELSALQHDNRRLLYEQRHLVGLIEASLPSVDKSRLSVLMPRLFESQININYICSKFSRVVAHVPDFVSMTRRIVSSHKQSFMLLVGTSLLISGGVVFVFSGQSLPFRVVMPWWSRQVPRASAEPSQHMPADVSLGPARFVKGSAMSLVDLKATGTTWVEVAEPQGTLLLQDTLHQGDHRRIRLRNGLEIFAARPDQLNVRIDEGVWQPFPQDPDHPGLIRLVPQEK